MQEGYAHQAPGNKTSETALEPAIAKVVGHWVRVLTESAEDIVSLISSSGELRIVNGGMPLYSLIGYDDVAFCRMSPRDWLHPEDASRAIDGFRSLVKEPSGKLTIEYRIRHRQGHYVNVTSTGINRLDDKVVRAIVVRTCANDDEMPSSWGRTTFPHLHEDASLFSVVEDAVQRANTDTTYHFSVLILELNKLMMLVGNYGQQVVDRLLRKIGQRLLALLRPDDMIADLGEGKFGIFLNLTGTRQQADRVAARILATIGTRFDIDDHVITPSAIIGIATSERRYESAEDVLRDAASAVNRAGGGARKRRAVFRTQMRLEDQRYMSIVSELHHALQQEQFILHYQPIVDLRNGQLSGFEALLRWLHPEKGLMPPGAFIPVAEETGLIVPIGQWVLKEACRQMKGWQLLGDAERSLCMSVNLSPAQIAEDDIVRQIDDVLRTTEIGPPALKLELTESAVLENPESAIACLRTIQQRGVRLALDDFGTGYSSFSNLHQAAYDTLKIDRSFVASIEQQSKELEIVQAIVVLAHNLGMDVVAEGVETAEQAHLLRDVGCEYAQGYYFGRPVDCEQASAHLNSETLWPAS